jgi:DNA gyrase subunit B
VAEKVEATISREEEHSSWRVTFKDPTNAERAIDIELATQPEYKRLRSGARAAAKFNRPPFIVVKDNHRDTLPGWRELLAHVKNEGTREVNVQRYKGLGEMNAEQLWSTTMNIETRTLLKVSLEDLVQADQIFTTLMGEDVESRRKFIEDNALDVRNLDV